MKWDSKQNTRPSLIKDPLLKIWLLDPLKCLDGKYNTRLVIERIRYITSSCYKTIFFQNINVQQNQILLTLWTTFFKSSSFPSSYYGGDNRFFLKKCWSLLFGVRTGYCGCGKRGCPSRVIHPVEQRSSMATTTAQWTKLIPKVANFGSIFS